MNAPVHLPPATAPASPAPQDLVITPRDLRFGREGKPRWWLNDDPIATAWHNALSSTFPRGEAFFVESVKAFRAGTPPRLAAEIRAFIAQEVNHSREHAAFNRAAEQAGYDLSEIDQLVARWILRTKGRPAIVNLAATMALEHFTAMIAHEFLTRPEHLGTADAESAAMWRWHAVEEIEHKAVAYDTYRHATREWSRWKRWKLKAIMMVLITWNFTRHRIRDTMILLAQDGLTGRRVKWRLYAYLFWKPGVLRRVVPAWIGYFLPGFHPWNQDDRALIASAVAEYSR
jgi:predicted metal-dependent hydrolase